MELYERSPNPRSSASAGLIARDQIARMKQAALERRKAKHTYKLGTTLQMSIFTVLAATSVHLPEITKSALNPPASRTLCTPAQRASVLADRGRAAFFLGSRKPSGSKTKMNAAHRESIASVAIKIMVCSDH